MIKRIFLKILRHYSSYLPSKLRNRVTPDPFLRIDVSSIHTPEPVSSVNKEFRINLLITSMNKPDIYAGIKTALDFFVGFTKYLKAEQRILVMDKKIDLKNVYLPNGYNISNGSDDQDKIMVDLFKRQQPLSIRENDIFIATFWDTAYTILSLKEWFKKTYYKEFKIIYLIQDYEPGFYPWSTNFLLAESTYHHKENILAVFNSSYLKKYFDNHGYEFNNCYTYNPKINSHLKNKLIKIIQEGHPIKKRNQILIYGRPSKPRNGYQLIVLALNEWFRDYPKAKDWEVYSAGENIMDIKTPNGLIIHSLGKLSIEEYAKFLMETKIGIALMVSPHPSYIPLEMAAFGIKVITNHFSNKDLSEISPNIHSLKDLSVKNLSEEITKLVTENNIGEIKITSYFEDDSNQWNQIYNNLSVDLKLKINESSL